MFALRSLLVKRFQSLAAEIDVEHFFARLGCLRMAGPAAALGPRRWGWRGSAQGLGHQGKGPTADHGEANQVNANQDVFHGSPFLWVSLV